MARPCPQCCKPLITKRFHGIDLELCTTCTGLWFDADVLRKLIVMDPIAINSLDDHVLQQMRLRTSTTLATPGILNCPQCSLPLLAQRYEYNSPIHLNSCPNCGGFWILERELHGLQNWLDQEHMPLSAEAAMKLEIAKIGIEHDAVMYRQERLREFFGVLQQRVFWPG